MIIILPLFFTMATIAMPKTNPEETDFELYISKNKILQNLHKQPNLLKQKIFIKRNEHILIDRKNTQPIFTIIKIPLKAKNGKYFLVIEDCFLDKITLFDQSKILETGARYPFSSRQIAFHYPTFLIIKSTLKPTFAKLSFQNFYHNSVIPIKLFSESEFQSYIIKSYLFWGFYLGILILTLFVSLWMFIANQEIIFGYVFLAILSGIFWVIFNNGLGFQFIWPNTPKLMETGRFISYQLSYFFLLICFQKFIKITLKTRLERGLLKTLKFFIIASIIMSFNPLHLTNNSPWLSIYFFYANSLLILTSVYILYYLIKEINNHNLNAWFYFISIIMIFAATIGLTLMKYEIIKPNNYLLQLNYLGILIQVITLIIGLLIQHFFQKKAHEQLQVNLIKAKSEERQRIAIDMHDELGSSISTIKLISELGLKHNDTEKINETLELIYSKSIQINKKLKDIIWTLHSTNDSLESVLLYIFDYGNTFFNELSIKFIMNYPDEIPVIIIDSINRRHLVLIIKEIFQNIAKHANSKSAVVNIKIINQTLMIEIRDFGIGFNENDSKGNGIKNIKERIKYLNGQIEIIQQNGVVYQLNIPL